MKAIIGITGIIISIYGISITDNDGMFIAGIVISGLGGFISGYFITAAIND